MIKRDKLLQKYIRPPIHCLVNLCTGDPTYLAHIWDGGIEINKRVRSECDSDLFGYAYLYLSGFDDRHEKELLSHSDMTKEFDQFFLSF